MKEGRGAPFTWDPAPYQIADVYALKAVFAGTATEDQQKRAISWVMEAACGMRDMTFQHDARGGDRATAFAEGKRFVGLQIAKLIFINPDQLRPKEQGQ